MLTTAAFKHESADIDRKEASKQWQNEDNIDGSSLFVHKKNPLISTPKHILTMHCLLFQYIAEEQKHKFLKGFPFYCISDRKFFKVNSKRWWVILKPILRKIYVLDTFFCKLIIFRWLSLLQASLFSLSAVSVEWRPVALKKWLQLTIKYFLFSCIADRDSIRATYKGWLLNELSLK